MTSAPTSASPAITPGAPAMPPLNLMKWVEDHKADFKPPVGNKYLYDGTDFFVMLIGGPNARNDFHVTDSEEFFHQLKGDMVVTIIENGEHKQVPIREGETFFIPGGVPHSPQRQPGTIGLVVERRRPAGETEHMQFYCPSCNGLAHDQEFDCADIVEHFARAMEEFWADPERSTCANCGHRITKPTPIKKIHFEPEIRIEREDG
jgi:3-hydroxyanthranilate 3,4-dioxygenase